MGAGVSVSHKFMRQAFAERQVSSLSEPFCVYIIKERVSFAGWVIFEILPPERVKRSYFATYLIVKASCGIKNFLFSV